MPTDIEPQLATAAKQVPAHGDWAWELKFDGYRMMTRIERGNIQLITRGGHDWTDRLPGLREALTMLEVDEVWLDGEAIVLNAAGRPDFNALQNAFDTRSTSEIILFFFDLLWLNGKDFRMLPLRERREELRALLESVESPLLRFSVDFKEDAHSLLASARKMQLEGIMGKRADAPYRSGRSTDWIKLKCNKQQEFVIGGHTRANGVAAGVDSLLLGVYELDGSLRFAGSVQPFFKPRASAAFVKNAQLIGQPAPPFAKPPRRERGREYCWMRPEMVCEVEFLEWTKSGELRHAVFRSLREDKPARDVTVEPVVDVDGTETKERVEKTSAPAVQGARVVGGVKISNGTRVIDAVGGHTKLEVVRYYEAIAEWAQPYLQNRPLSLLRAPEGIGGEQFFQKHSEKFRIPGVDELPAEMHPNHARLMVANNQKALIGLAQMGVIELHTWNASAPDLDHPDRVIFDLDPDPALPWRTMIEAAMLVKVALDEIGLTSFPKTSGGKGIHVVVPLTRKQSWAEVKAFSKALAQHMAQVVPQRFSAVSGPKNRVGKIFIDYLRNAKGASTVAAFSVRARPGMGVSMPVAWEEIPTLTSGDQWNMKTAVARQVRLGGDVWEGYAKTKQGITTSMRRTVSTKR
jgi:bifunctional non-homologous end joining protein LigD